MAELESDVARHRLRAAERVPDRLLPLGGFLEYAVLRLLHLFFGAIWVGGAIGVSVFVVPSVVEAGPGGGAVMRGMVQRKFQQAMIGSGVIAVLTGLRLYMLRFSMAWVATPEGIVLTIGGVLAIAALVIGLVVQAPTSRRLATLGGQVAASGGPPTPEQAAELGRLQRKMQRLGKVLAGHLAAAMLFMSSMRLALLF